MLLTEGQVSDYRGAESLLPALPDAVTLIANKGYDSDRFREALAESEIEPCIPAQPKETRGLRHRSLQTEKPHRAHVRQAQGLETHRHMIRPMRPYLLQRHLYRCYRHILVMSFMSLVNAASSGNLPHGLKHVVTQRVIVVVEVDGGVTVAGNDEHLVPRP